MVMKNIMSFVIIHHDSIVKVVQGACRAVSQRAGVLAAARRAVLGGEIFVLWRSFTQFSWITLAMSGWLLKPLSGAHWDLSSRTPGKLRPGTENQTSNNLHKCTRPRSKYWICIIWTWDILRSGAVTEVLAGAADQMLARTTQEVYTGDLSNLHNSSLKLVYGQAKTFPSFSLFPCGSSAVFDSSYL